MDVIQFFLITILY